jgi:AcrR family transcriptional regulator
MAIRSETSRKAVLQAALDLLSDTPPGPVSLRKLSIEGIARQAGVSKMTIYRWWSDKTALVIDSFLENHIARTPIPAEGRAIDALRSHLIALTEVYAGPEGRLIAQLLAECQFDPATLGTFKERFWQGRVEAVEALIERAKTEGDLRQDVGTGEIANLLYAPVYFRLLMQTGDLNAEATEKYVDAALAGLSVGARVGQKA